MARLLLVVASCAALVPQLQPLKTVPRLEDGSPLNFVKDFSRPMSIPEEGIENAIEVMRSGRLFRYCATSSET